VELAIGTELGASVYIVALTELIVRRARKQRVLMRGEHVIVSAVESHFVNSSRKII
jgi:hypothetical protein